jgi:hypothetical protein
MVRFSKLFSISLDSVHDYGSKLKLSIQIRKDKRMSEPQNGRGALFAGGLAAILASTCCLGPLVLIALGFSGAGSAT